MVGEMEYNDCTTAVELDHSIECPGYKTKFHLNVIFREL